MHEWEQAGLLQYQITTLGRRNPSFVEDFSDELIPQITPSAANDSAATPATTEDQSRLFDYIVEDGTTLGSGQYGVVKRGHYRHNIADKFAVKIIPKRRLKAIPARGARLPDPNGEGKLKAVKMGNTHLSIPGALKKELEILQRLDHPGIVRMHHCIDLPEQTWIIMDLADGGDLLDYVMKRTKLSESDTKLLMRQVVLAMQYLHEHGIIHRDLKVSINIYLLLSYLITLIIQ
jgi:serine/threonine protein kinase